MLTVLLEQIHASADPILGSIDGIRIERHVQAGDLDRLAPVLPEVEILGIRSRTLVDRELFERAPRLKAIGAYCTGTNNIDLDAAREHGVAVFNGPFSNTRSVAELVISHAIALMRRVPERHAAARRGDWLKDASRSNEVRGKTLGIVGYGKIGTQTGLLAEAIGMRVLFHDVEARLPLGNARPTRSLDELLAQSDIVTIHVPQSPDTEQLIGAERLARMKDDAVLINLARGRVIDIDALCDALDGGRLRGAAIDVFPVEPKSARDPFESPLRSRDNVILTPHVGGSTIEAQANLGIEVSEKLRDYLTTGAVRGSVSLPDVSVSTPRAACRLVHIHRDRPGMILQLNRVLADENINVSQMHLETGSGTGIAVVDMATPPTSRTLDAICAIDGTLRAFVTKPAR
jgi:D-3-phosphoglycerate dehydrogenase